MNQSKKSDHSPSPRYAVKTDIFLMLRPFPERLGRLKEVGNDGATFEYAVFGKYDKILDAEAEADIFASMPCHFTLMSVRCRVVRDVEIKKPTFNGTKTRLCSVRFERLSDQQGEQVRFLLNNYASDPISGECMVGDFNPQDRC